MNVFHKTALQSLKKSRTRTFVTIIGVVLSAALITAVATFGVSLLHYLADGAAAKYGGWHVAFSDVDSAFADRQAHNKAVADTTTYENIGYAKLGDAKFGYTKLGDAKFGDAGNNDAGNTDVRNTDKPYLFVAGFNKKTFDDLPLTLLSGRMPKGRGEVLISGSVLSKGGASLAVGDTLNLSMGNRMRGDRKLGQSDAYLADKETFVPTNKQSCKVVGICQTPDFEPENAPGYTVITTGTAMDTGAATDTGDTTDTTDTVDTTDTADAGDTANTRNTANGVSLFVTLKHPYGLHSYIKSAAGAHAYMLHSTVLRFLGIADNAGDRLFNALLYSVGGIVIAIVMIGSIFLIYNSFHISLSERIHQFGMLASVGATAGQLRSSVFFEGLCIGAVGIPIGVLAGLGGTWLVIRAVAKNFGSVMYDNVSLTLAVSPAAIIAAVVLSLVTILISAYIPARKAANTPVMECIRQTNEVRIEAGTVKTSGLAQRIYGLEGTLALKNFKRNRKRYRSIVLSLVLSVVLFVSTNAFVKDLKQAMGETASVTTYDIGFGTRDIKDGELEDLFDKLKTADGVSESSYQVDMQYTCAAKASDLSRDYRKSAGIRAYDSADSDKALQLPMSIQFLDETAYLKLVRRLGLPKEKYTGRDAKLPAVAVTQGGTAQSDKEDQLKNVFKDSVIHATITPDVEGRPDTAQNMDVDLTIVKMVLPDIPPVLGGQNQKDEVIRVIAPYSLKEKYEGTSSPADIIAKGMTFQSENPQESLGQMKSMIDGAKVSAGYTILNMTKTLDENRNYIFIANVFAYTFIILISLIAVANVFNTISTNIKLRRRELAILRSVGMSDRDFNKMMRFECAFYGIRALLFGLPIAAAVSWLIYTGMVHGGMSGIRFSLPWVSIGISVFSVLLVIFITMMYAVSKIKKENIIDALRDDME